METHHFISLVRNMARELLETKLIRQLQNSDNMRESIKHYTHTHTQTYIYVLVSSGTHITQHSTRLGCNPDLKIISLANLLL